MTAPRANLHVVERPPATGQPRPTTRLQQARALARAMAAEDRALAALSKARAEVAARFIPFAGGRRLALGEARAHLVSTGLLPEPARAGETIEDKP